MTGPRLGRPRDPKMSGRIIDTVIDLLAARGVGGFTMQDVADRSSVGKASMYRRWDSIDQLLVDVARDLGPRADDITWPDPGEIRGDLIALLSAATIGPRARAQAALVSLLPYRPELRQAWIDGPLARLADTLGIYQQRILDRGERLADAPGAVRVTAAYAWLMLDAAQHGDEPERELVGQVVDHMLTEPAPRHEDVNTPSPGGPERLAYLTRLGARDDDYTAEAIDRTVDDAGQPEVTR